MCMAPAKALVQHGEQANIHGQDAERVFSQLSLNEATKKHGGKALQAALKEMKQSDARSVFEPLDWNSLTPEDCKKAINSLTHVKEKRDDCLKGRACADGRPQRQCADKEDAASPTAALESIALTAAINAKEGRDVATVDIPNAFVQTDMEGEKVIMAMKGRLAKLLMQTDPELCRKHVAVQNGQPVLCVELLKALHGALKAASLFHKKSLKDLEDKGFELNPYDLCVVNKMINGKQCTMAWHVDDLKMSHADHRVVDKLIKWLKGKHEDKEIGTMKATRGKAHEHLGVILDFRKKGALKIDMVDCATKMVKDFPVNLADVKEVKTPAAEHLLKVRDAAPKLNEHKAQMFHNMVARGLFVCKRSRGDIQPTIAFLTTRVSKPNEDDWKKLMRMMKHLDETKDLVPTLTAGKSNTFKWHTDAAHAVHPDCRSHTGGSFAWGTGAICNASLKQKLNGRSSAKSELTSVDNLMPQMLWTKCFLEAQGCVSEDTLVFQDNKSTMLLEKNGKASSGKRTKHINIRCFFAKDRHDKGEINIKHWLSNR